MRSGTLTLLFMLAAGCTPAQRTAAGIGIGGTGVAVTYGALASMIPSCQKRSFSNNVCTEYTKALPHEVGFPLAFGGVGAVVLGGMIVATAGKGHRRPRPHDTAPPEPPPAEPVALYSTQAVAMAVARLVITGKDRSESPALLGGVDDTQSSLNVQGRRAELRNLRIRTAKDPTWRMVDACYEYRKEWRLTSFETTASCSR
jgi:hypothetical protein